MKRLAFLFSISIGITLAVQGQTTTLYSPDSAFLTQDTIGSWSFKENLKKGSYWLIDSNECGIDTLQFAYFITDGVKHGNWIEWRERMCLGLVDSVTNEVYKWVGPASKQNLKEFLTEYKNGRKIKMIWYYDEVEEPMIEWNYYYNKHGELIMTEQNAWREDGTLKLKIIAPNTK